MKNEDTIAAENWAKKLFERDFLILDTETTGLGKTDQICQIAICNKYGKALLNTLVRPDVPITPAAFRTHGISNGIVSSFPRFPHIYPHFNEIVGGKDVVIYNAPFDRRIIRQCCDFYQLKYPRCRDIHCAMKWNSQWYGWERKSGRGYRSKPLKGGDHSAMGDCLALLELIKEMAGASEKTDNGAVVEFRRYV